PVVQLVLFGYAINLNVRGIAAGIADQANTAGSRAAVMDILATGVVAPVTEVRTPQELVDLLRRGEISVGIAIPPDFERRKADGGEAVQVMVDGSDTSVQGAAAQLAQMPLDARAGGGEAPMASTPPIRPVSVVAF